MKKPKKLKTKPFFNPDEIVHTISQALNRDLEPNNIHEYVGIEGSRYFVDRQCKEFAKKYASPSVDQSPLEIDTFIKFLFVNEHMGKVARNFVPPPRNAEIGFRTPQFERILIRAKKLMYEVLGDVDMDEIFLQCKNSSGSSMGVPFWDTSPERKLSYPITVTKRAKPLFDLYLDFDTTLKSAMDSFNAPIIGKYKIVESSRASTVDKTNSIRRMICVEPTANMFLQQGLMQVLYSRMKKVNLNVSTLPDLHKKMAKESSLTSQYATIDWSSASDCVLPALLEWLLPQQWYWYVDILRCSTTEILGNKVKLNMISTMGNAATFPLETLVFWVMAQAVQLTLDRPKSPTALFDLRSEEMRRVSVFGDDCIVPTASSGLFIESLEKVGFIINDDKSFYGTELFRESCGGDYLAGTAVRPYNIKAPTSTKKSALESWLYTIFNSLEKIYIRFFGELTYIYDKAVFRALFALFAKYRLDISLVPSFFPDDAGLKISDDIGRWSNHYEFILKPIYRCPETHGVAFRYRRWVYWNRKDVDPAIRYAMWLKKPYLRDNDRVDSRPIRRKGGYVEAKTRTSFWDLESIVCDSTG